MFKKSRAVFLCLSGASLLDAPLGALKQPGIITCGVNNSPSIIRPNLWVGHDASHFFISSIWNDPTIMKFTKFNQRHVPLWDSELDMSPVKLTEDCPNVYYYKPDALFNPDSWCESEKVGCNYKGSSSVFLAAIKILVALGFPRIVLVGCDFNMDSEKSYAFDQERNEGWVNKNNELYGKLNEAMTTVQPNMKRHGCTVVNTNPHSGLTTVPYRDINREIEDALLDMPNTYREKTKGMYNISIHDKFKTSLQTQ